MQILQYILLFKEQFCKVEVYISVLGWKFRYSKLCWEKEYVHIEYSGPLTRLSSVLCKTLYTYIYLGDTKLHICKKKLPTSYVLQKKNFLVLVILKFRFSKKAAKVCQDLPLLRWCRNLIYRRPKKAKNWSARSPKQGCQWVSLSIYNQITYWAKIWFTHHRLFVYMGGCCFDVYQLFAT